MFPDKEKGHKPVTYADKRFLPLARLAANTFLPFDVNLRSLSLLRLKCHLHTQIHLLLFENIYPIILKKPL